MALRVIAMLMSRCRTLVPALPLILAIEPAWPATEMADTMQMDDSAPVWKLLLDQLEWRDGNLGEARAAWDGEASYGGDIDKLWLKSEGTYIANGQDSGVRDASVDALWSRVVSPWWTGQAGLRQDFGQSPSRTWVALGIEGLAPQWVETEATVYAGEGGHTAARLKAEYDLLLTQRLVLQPFLEANAYGRSDPQRQIGSGLSDLQLSARLRFEIRREIAPYVGIVWLRRFGATADLTRAAGGQSSEVELAAGIHVII